MSESKIPRFVTIAELVRMLSVPTRKPGVTTSQIRTLIYRRNQNGLGPHIRRPTRRRWLIDVDGFLGWLQEETQALDRRERDAIDQWWRTLKQSLHPSENIGRTMISLNEERAKRECAHVN